MGAVVSTHVSLASSLLWLGSSRLVVALMRLVLEVSVVLSAMASTNVFLRLPVCFLLVVGFWMPFGIGLE
jgi:hypothetical protein